MQASTPIVAQTAAAGRPRSRLTTLIVMGITAVAIFALAVLANQPAATADGVTAVTLTGDVSGPGPIVGQAAPDFAATTVDGQPVQLSDFKGQPVWLTFGASWCQPCRAENADIKAVAERYADEGLVVLAVFINEDAAAVTDYADRVGLDYLKVADPGTTIASRYRILGIPSHFFVDPSGNLAEMRVGTMDVPAMEASVEALRP